MNSDQRFRDLTDEDRKWLSDQRARVEQLLDGNPDAQRKYQTSAGKLGTIRAVLEGGIFRADQTFELQGLGIILGDAISAEMGVDWKMVEDQYGTSPCLALKGTSVVLYPQTMISKRVERGETVDVFNLFNWLCSQIDELKAKEC